MAETLIEEGEARSKAISLIQFIQRRFSPLPAEPSKVKITYASIRERDK